MSRMTRSGRWRSIAARASLAEWAIPTTWNPDTRAVKSAWSSATMKSSSTTSARIISRYLPIRPAQRLGYGCRADHTRQQQLEYGPVLVVHTQLATPPRHRPSREHQAQTTPVDPILFGGESLFEDVLEVLRADAWTGVAHAGLDLQAVISNLDPDDPRRAPVDRVEGVLDQVAQRGHQVVGQFAHRTESAIGCNIQGDASLSCYARLAEQEGGDRRFLDALGQFLDQGLLLLRGGSNKRDRPLWAPHFDQ